MITHMEWQAINEIQPYGSAPGEMVVKLREQVKELETYILSIALTHAKAVGIDLVVETHETERKGLTKMTIADLSTRVRAVLTDAALVPIKRRANPARTASEYWEAWRDGLCDVLAPILTEIAADNARLEAEVERLSRGFAIVDGVPTVKIVDERLKPGWEIYCEHANENPNICPCPPTCGCRQTSMCRDKPLPVNEQTTIQPLDIKVRMYLSSLRTQILHLRDTADQLASELLRVEADAARLLGKAGDK